MCVRHFLQDTCKLIAVGILARGHPVPLANDNASEIAKEVHEGLRSEILHMHVHLRPFLPLVEGVVTVLAEEKMPIDLSLVNFLLNEVLPGSQHLAPPALAALPTKGFQDFLET